MSEQRMSIGERLHDSEESLRRLVESKTDNLRVAMPGKIISFDAEKQTATVQPLIKEYVRDKWESLPRLLDVPCFFPRAGGYCLTFPVKPGDEVIIMFNDMCLDSWWQSGGEQTQLEIRRHDLSDAMCLLGITSVPKAVEDYSTNSVMLRNEDKDSYIEIVDDDKTVNIVGAEKLNVTVVDDINVTTDADINVTARGDVTVESAANVTIRCAGNMSLEAGGILSLKAPGLRIEGEIAHSGNMQTSGAHVDSVGSHCSC